MKKTQGGFVIIIVLSVMAVLVLISAAIINISCSEAVQMRVQSDGISAGYLASAGGERMYAMIANKWRSIATEQWTTLSIPKTNLTVNGSTIGSYTVNAYKTSNPREFNIISLGEANGRTVTVTTKYGYRVDYSNGIPLSSLGGMSLLGHKVLWWKFMVTADGPIQSAAAIVPNGNADPAYSPNNRYVQYSGSVAQNTSMTPPTFWLYNRFDTTGTSVEIPHSNPDYITLAEAQAQELVVPGALAAFNANNVYTTTAQDVDRIDDKDGFYYYYTGHLNEAENNSTGTHLNIDEGEENYMEGTTNFGPWAVPEGNRIVFVDGDVNVFFNAQEYWQNPSDLTIVSMNDIFIVQPVNGPDDRLTLIAYDDVVTGGINLNQIADVEGNLVMYAGDDFDAVLGGVTNGPIFAEDDITVDTQWTILFSSREFNAGTDSWSNEADWPLGLPSGFPTFEQGYHVRNEDVGADESTNYNPRWQKRQRG